MMRYLLSLWLFVSRVCFVSSNRYIFAMYTTLTHMLRVLSLNIKDTYELSPFCSEALEVLRSTDTNFKEVSLGKEWIPGLIESPEKRAALLEMTGQSSLPHVFIGGTSIGGLYSGNPGLIPALEKGELMDMINEAKRSM